MMKKILIRSAAVWAYMVFLLSIYARISNGFDTDLAVILVFPIFYIGIVLGNLFYKLVNED